MKPYVARIGWDITGTVVVCTGPFKDRGPEDCGRLADYGWTVYDRGAQRPAERVLGGYGTGLVIAGPGIQFGDFGEAS